LSQKGFTIEDVWLIDKDITSGAIVSKVSYFCGLVDEIEVKNVS